MYCNPVSQSYNSQNTIIKLPNLTPEPYSITGLNLKANRILHDRDAPLLPKIWPLTQYLRFEIIRETVGWHLVRCLEVRPLRSGARGRARTCDLLIRSQTLYPTELRAPGGVNGKW
jgi:hypothetical protein